MAENWDRYSVYQRVALWAQQMVSSSVVRKAAMKVGKRVSRTVDEKVESLALKMVAQTVAPMGELKAVLKVH